MIVIDTSALMAIMSNEPERENFTRIISRHDARLISAMTLFECRMVTFGLFHADGIARLSNWLQLFTPEIVPFDHVQAAAAFAAFQTYGKGIHSKARLNFGDCASYALAKTRNLPLLFKGGDFAATAIVAATLQGTT